MGMDSHWEKLCKHIKKEKKESYLWVDPLWIWDLNDHKCWHLQAKNDVLLDACAVCWIHNKYVLQVINIAASTRQFVSKTKDSKPGQQQKQMGNTRDINSKTSTLTARPWQKPYEEPRNIIMKYRCISQTCPPLLSLVCVCVCFWWEVCVCFPECSSFALSSRLLATALIDVTGRGRESGDLAFSASDGSIEIKQGNASPSPPTPLHPSFLPVQSSGRNRKSTLQQRWRTS